MKANARDPAGLLDLLKVVGEGVDAVNVTKKTDGGLCLVCEALLHVG